VTTGAIGPPVDEPSAQVGHPVIRVHDGAWQEGDDLLAAEEPMEIRLLWEADGWTERKSLAITMRTPGDDFELALGFLHGEGIIRSREDVLDVSYCLDVAEDQRLNVVTVTLRAGLTIDLDRLDRHFYTTSSCGVCGKAALDALDLQGFAPLPAGPDVRTEVIRALPDKLRREQAVFRSTGGLHASGLFDLEGNLLDLREDVGRHNALDKLIGHQLMQNQESLAGKIVLLSGRASFELLQKALAARVPIVAAVGAPSSLAVELAANFNVTLLGFVRRDGFNVYTGKERVTASAT
jgi:FdhD protein